ncbi:hypothetical protein MTO96_032251 [Rhipicephalus appendiculatus]
MLRWTPDSGKDDVFTSRLENALRMRQVRAGVVGLETTERYKAISEVLSRPIGDFQANRFFSFPAMIDTRAIAILVEAVWNISGAFKRRGSVSTLYPLK